MTVTDTGLQARYEETGYLTGIDVLDAGEVARARRSFDELERSVPAEQRQIGLSARHFQDEFVWRLANAPAVLAVMEQVVGPDLLLLGTHFFNKQPDPSPSVSASSFVAWHQDVTYWGLEPAAAHSAWIAIDDSDVANGCMRVLPRSHREGVKMHGTAERQGNLLSVNQEIPDDQLDTSGAVDLVLRAGQMSVHHGRLVHASNPNRSTRRRCGMVARFISPAVKQVNPDSYGHYHEPVLVRGQDRYHHFPARSAPF